jgi:tyrosyl-DNA phosphodiesterase 2
MERYVQAEHVLAALGSSENVVFGGDMSWDDNTDLPFPLPAGWVDPWTNINPYSIGNTLDGDRIAPFRDGSLYPSPEKRSDRFACKLRDYALRSSELVGTNGDPGSGVNVCVQNMTRLVELRPSCHRGVVLTIVPVSVPVVLAP